MLDDWSMLNNWWMLDEGWMDDVCMDDVYMDVDMDGWMDR
jgi:hypothetical protein